MYIVFFKFINNYLFLLRKCRNLKFLIHLSIFYVYNKSKISNKGLAINEQKLLLSTIYTLTILNILNIDNIGYAKNYGTIEEAKNIQTQISRSIHLMVLFTYTYGKSNGNVNNGRNNNDDGQHNISQIILLDKIM